MNPFIYNPIRTTINLFHYQQEIAKILIIKSLTNGRENAKKV